MDDRSLKFLEYHHLLALLKEYALSPLGRRRCEALRPSHDVALIQSRLTEVMELKGILETAGDLPLGGLKDIGDIFNKLEIEGSVLEVRELLDCYDQLVLCRGLKRFFEKLETVSAPCLQEKASGLSSQKELEKAILRTINPQGEILDQASPALSDIRQRLGKVREKAKGMLDTLLRQESLQPIFQEQLITLRNGRYVLLIKSDAENPLEGIIHDQSQSRMTFFFEPLQVITLNNEVNILIGEEKEEEYRILAELTAMLRAEKQNLRNDFDILEELDFLYAMAKFSLLLKGVSPLLNTEGKIEIQKARNPLLMIQRETQVIPIDLRLGDGVRTIIISGANAGGKTVALKTLGLLTLMAQSGLPIPAAEGSQVGIFEDVFAVIGDEQNIEENLSTFSSHLLHVDHILKVAGPRSLVLLDELGVGTHAQEGCALAMGFLDQFRERGASVVVTTHFDRLKEYGYLYPDVENVSVEFDEKTLEPKYTLAYGASGLSNAFLIAEKLGISEKVLKAARIHSSGSGEATAQTLEMLERLKQEAEQEKQQAVRIREEMGVERDRLKRILETLREKKMEIYARVEAKARKAVQKVEEELKEWVQRRKQEKVSYAVQRKEIHEIHEKRFPGMRRRGPSAFPDGLKVGERVRIESLRSTGILTNVNQPLKRAEVLTDKGKVDVPFSEIVQATNQDEKRETGSPKKHPLIRGEIDEPVVQLKVIGLTVEEALVQVDKFIDQALLHELEQVQIIHGIGSGRLRDAIGKFLSGHRAVKHLAPAERAQGGPGVTIVELR